MKLPFSRLPSICSKNPDTPLFRSARPPRAIEEAAKYPGDIVLLLTDVIMPEMDGRALAERFQAIRPHIRVLYMSGYTADVLSPHGVLEGGVMFLPKPFSRQTLREKVREALGVRLRV